MTFRHRILRQQLAPEQAAKPGKLQRHKNSKLVTFNGETLSVTEWARRLKLDPETLRARLKRNMPLEKALQPGNRSKLKASER
jgi:hypothetical protein